VPRLTPQRISSEIGVGACLSTFATFGWIGEVVQGDFGEDIAFQTSFRQRVDPFRVYAQVKTFDRFPKHISISTAHLRKWMLHVEPLLLIAYERSSRTLVGATIQSLFRYYVFDSDGVEKVAVSKLQPLTEDHVSALLWGIRSDIFRYINYKFANRTSDYLNLSRSETGLDKDKKIVALRVSELRALCWFFDYMNLVEHSKKPIPKAGTWARGLKSQIKTRLSGKYVGLRKVGLKFGLTIRQSCALIVLAEWNDVTNGQGLPSELIDACARWMEFLITSELVDAGVDPLRLAKLKIL
jgi:hypothetical protein